MRKLDRFSRDEQGRLLLPEKALARFWEKVDRSAGQHGCWEWLAAKNGRGYGSFGIGTVTFKTHQLSYEIHVGPRPDGLCVLHSCHNRICINPAHLRLGTVRENAIEMAAAGRGGPQGGRWVGETRSRMAKLTAADRFWKKVVKGEGCWEWTGCKTPSGHGQMTVNYRRTSPHRFSYELHYGLIPLGMEVCHRCDNPPCVRPDHLFLGTQADNLRDMRKKGRHNPARGLRNANAKLGNDRVMQARSDYAAGVAVLALSRKYGVSYDAMWKAVKGDTYKHLPIPDYTVRVPLEWRHLQVKTKRTDRAFSGATIRDLRVSLGLSQVELARLCGLSAISICSIETGKHNPRPCAARRISGALGVPLTRIEEGHVTRVFRSIPKDGYATGTGVTSR